MDLARQAHGLKDYIIERRRWLHAHPELAFTERETTAYVAGELAGMGVGVQTFADYQGLIGTIAGGLPGPVIMLRADIDALPIREQSGLPFASTNGLMHACGHDCHCAMLLGAAKLLSAGAHSLPGTVKLLFQSGEEAFGADYYAQNGCLDGVDMIFGLHVWPTLASGQVNIEPGLRMASNDIFTVTVRPGQRDDIVLAAHAVVIGLQSLQGQINQPPNPLVITVGKINGGHSDRQVEMRGTIRTFSLEVRDKLEEALQNCVQHSAALHGCAGELNFTRLEDAVNNERADLVQLAQNAATGLFGEATLASLPPVTGSEDFSFLTRKAPGVFAFLGSRNESCGAIWPLHSEKFTVDEDILWRGAALYAQVAHDYLSGGEA